MAIYTNKNRNSASFKPTARHGRDIIIGDVANLTFEDPMFLDGTLVKDATFEQMQQQVWANKAKSNEAGWTNKTRN